MRFPASPTGPGMADLLPEDIAGNANGVLYVPNPSGGETVYRTDPASPYYDDQLCHHYNSGAIARDSKCATTPATANWKMPLQYAASAVPPLGYKWVRINMKTNRVAAPYFVDQKGDPTTLDTRVCWDGRLQTVSRRC